MIVKTMKLLGKVQKQYNEEIVIGNNSVVQVSFETTGYFSYQKDDIQGVATTKLFIPETIFQFDNLEIGKEYQVILDRHMFLLGITEI